MRGSSRKMRGSSSKMRASKAKGTTMPEDGTQDAQTVEKSVFDNVSADLKKWKDRAREFERSVTDLQGKVLSDEDRELFETLRTEREQAAEEIAKKKGDIDSIKQQLTDKYTRQLEAEQTAKTAALAGYAELAVKTPIQAKLAEAGVTDVEAAEHLIQTLHDHRAVAEFSAGKPVVKVVDRDGHPVLDADAKAATIDTLVKGFLATDRGKRFLPATQDLGSGEHKGGPNRLGDEAILRKLDSSTALKTDFIQENGAEAYINLASRVRRAKANKKD